MVISQTPFRISFAGGGTDLKSFYSQEDGKVISTAIDKYIYVIVKERFDDLIVLNYSERETIEAWDDVKHDLIKHCAKLVGLQRGVEVTTLGDIPSQGSGLGSSSTVTVGLLHAFYAYKGVLVSAESLAQQACHIEIDLLGKPIGKQDQYIAAYGGIKFFTFKWDETVETEPVRLNLNHYHRLCSNLRIYYTGKTRDANQILKQQQKNTTKNLDTLRNIKQHANLIRASLEAGEIDELGVILNSTWFEKKRLVAQISNSDIDIMYKKASDAGALGGKICGAGAGGFLLLYVQPEKQHNVTEAMSEYRELPFLLERQGSKIIFNQRGYPWK